MEQRTRPVRSRRLVAGAAIIGCPLAGVLSSVFDADEGTDTAGDALYGIALAHGEGIWVAGLLFIVSAILTVPTAFGLMHLAAGRGAALAQVGAVFLVLGGFGHMGYGTWQLMVARIPGPGDEATLASYFDRASDVNLILLPMLMSIIVGLILASIAAHRSRAIPRWVPTLLVAVAVFDFVASSTSLGASKWTAVITWGLALAGLSRVGVSVLRMSDEAWTALYPGRRAQAPQVMQAASATAPGGSRGGV